MIWKRCTAAVLLMCSACLSGCEQVHSNTGGLVNENVKNTELSIYNIQNEEIGSICAYHYGGLVDSFVLYNALPEGRHDTSEVVYHLYDIETGIDYELCSVQDWAYESFYETIVYKDHAYVSISTGGYVERSDRTQTIYDIDLSCRSMTPILRIEGGMPYNSFTILDDTLFLAELLENGDTDLIEYDLSAPRDGQPLVHTYDESQCFVPDSIRRISTDGTNIHMVRLDWNEEEEYFLYMDTYDCDLNLLHTTDISRICSQENYADDIDQLISLETDVDFFANERMQWIDDFHVCEAYFFYNNFSAVSFLGSVENNGLRKLLETDIYFEYVYEPGMLSENDMFIHCYGNTNASEVEQNCIYMADAKTGEIQTAAFYADDPRYDLRMAFRNPDGKLLLTMGCIIPDQKERMPDRLYYLDTEDLTFRPL